MIGRLEAGGLSMGEPGQSSTRKILGAVVLLVVAIAFVYGQYARSRPRPLRPEPGPARAAGSEVPGRPAAGPGAQGFGFGPGMIPPEERIKFREEVYQQLNLTPEQQARLAEIDKKYDPLMRQGQEVALQRMREAGEVLTPDQREKAREAMREGMKKRITERIQVLPPEEQKKFLEKFDARFEQGRRMFEQGPAGPGQRPAPQQTPAGGATKP